MAGVHLPTAEAAERRLMAVAILLVAEGVHPAAEADIRAAVVAATHRAVVVGTPVVVAAMEAIVKARPAN